MTPRASAYPLGALYVCDDCRRFLQGVEKTYDAIRAAYHNRRTGHTLTAILEVRDRPS